MVIPQGSLAGWDQYINSISTSFLLIAIYSVNIPSLDKIADEPEQVKTNIGSISEKLDNLGMSEEESREKGQYWKSFFFFSSHYLLENAKVKLLFLHSGFT